MDFNKLFSVLGVSNNIFARIKQIFITLKNSQKKRIATLIVLAVTVLSLMAITMTYSPEEDILLILYSFTWRLVLMVVIIFIFTMYLFYLSGIMDNSYAVNAFRKINLLNHENEPPTLISKKENDNQVVYLFNTVGIPFDTFEKKKADIENALNISIVKMELGSNMHEIYIYAFYGKYELPEKVFLPKEFMSGNNPVLRVCE